MSDMAGNTIPNTTSMQLYTAARGFVVPSDTDPAFLAKVSRAFASRVLVVTAVAVAILQTIVYGSLGIISRSEWFRARGNEAFSVIRLATTRQETKEDREIQKASLLAPLASSLPSSWYWAAGTGALCLGAFALYMYLPQSVAPLAKKIKLTPKLPIAPVAEKVVFRVHTAAVSYGPFHGCGDIFSPIGMHALDLYLKAFGNPYERPPGV